MCTQSQVLSLQRRCSHGIRRVRILEPVRSKQGPLGFLFGSPTRIPNATTNICWNNDSGSLDRTNIWGTGKALPPCLPHLKGKEPALHTNPGLGAQSPDSGPNRFGRVGPRFGAGRSLLSAYRLSSRNSAGQAERQQGAEHAEALHLS